MPGFILIVCCVVTGYIYIRRQRKSFAKRVRDSCSFSMISDISSVQNHPHQKELECIRQIEILEISAPEKEIPFCKIGIQNQCTFPILKYHTLPNQKYDLAINNTINSDLNLQSMPKEDDMASTPEDDLQSPSLKYINQICPPTKSREDIATPCSQEIESFHKNKDTAQNVYDVKNGSDWNIEGQETFFSRLKFLPTSFQVPFL